MQLSSFTFFNNSYKTVSTILLLQDNLLDVIYYIKCIPRVGKRIGSKSVTTKAKAWTRKTKEARWISSAKSVHCTSAATVTMAPIRSTLKKQMFKRSKPTCEKIPEAIAFGFITLNAGSPLSSTMKLQYLLWILNINKNYNKPKIIHLWHKMLVV